MSINGVKLVKLKTNRDHRGFFREIFRFTEDYKEVSVGQLSHSVVNEGIIKGWHGHSYQSQWNYVVCGRIKVALYDDRKGSPTYGGLMEFSAGEIETPVGYYFPPGVLHGYKCESGPMHIIYVTSSTYDLDDEIRKEIEFVSHETILHE